MIGKTEVEEVDILGNGSIKVYVTKDCDCAYIANVKGEIVAVITADCAQNTGYLKVTKD